jgi:hypothetical protein
VALITASLESTPTPIHGVVHRRLTGSFEREGNNLKIRMNSMLATALAAVAFIAPQMASASLVYDQTILLTSQGFGNAPRDLTLQAQNANDPDESGCVGVGPGSTITYGTCVSPGQVYMGNAVNNSSSLDDLPNPRPSDPAAPNANKYGIPTIGSLGITSADQIGILFNADEPQNDAGGINVLDVTLKFYSPAGTLLGAIDGQHNFLSSDPGVGIAGFTFVVDDAQQNFVNRLIAMGGTGTRLALEASLGNFGGGPDTFLIFNTNTPNQVPEPATIALFGLGMLGFAASRRKSKNK